MFVQSGDARKEGIEPYQCRHHTRRSSLGCFPQRNALFCSRMSQHVAILNFSIHIYKLTIIESYKNKQSQSLFITFVLLTKIGLLHSKAGARAGARAATKVFPGA
jgi:hypothetical protein